MLFIEKEQRVDERGSERERKWKDGQRKQIEKEPLTSNFSNDPIGVLTFF
jgi:hypothetical protein